MRRYGSLLLASCLITFLASGCICTLTQSGPQPTVTTLTRHVGRVWPTAVDLDRMGREGIDRVDVVSISEAVAQPPDCKGLCNTSTYNNLISP